MPSRLDADDRLDDRGWETADGGQDDAPAPLPLTAASPGETVVIVSLCPRGFPALRLAELGLTPDTSLHVLRAQAGQPLLIAVRESRLAIDRRLAEAILVRRQTPPPCPGRHRRRRRFFR
jgi:Fe2+ transport system protein FeoA